MTSTRVPSTIKMEDVSPALLVATPPLSSSPSPAPSSPASTSQSSATKATKKRKSWGQILPEPKTNLPPRKRAKTEDEKEQRRIERVKRNRHAAHLSREKKRQEFDEVQSERDALAARVLELESQLQHYQELVSGGPFELPSGGIHAIPDFQFNDLPTPTPSIAMNSQATCPSPPPTDFTEGSLDFSLETLSPAEDSAAPIQTQHSAAMLCDLQCRIGASGPLTETPSQRHRYFQAMILYVISTNLQIFLTSLSLTRFWTLTTLVQRFLISAATSNNNLHSSMSFAVQQSSSNKPTLAQHIATSLALLCRFSTGPLSQARGKGADETDLMLRSWESSDRVQVEPDIMRAFARIMVKRHGHKEIYRSPPKRKGFSWR